MADGLSMLAAKLRDAAGDAADLAAEQAGRFRLLR